MRGHPESQRSLLLIGALGDRVPAGHPIRAVKVLADEALASLGKVFDGMYAALGRPSIPPERLLKAQLLIALFSICSDRQLCEQLEYNLMFRWFLDMEFDEPAFDASSFSQNRERLIRHRVGEEFLAAVVKAARSRHLLSTEIGIGGGDKSSPLPSHTTGHAGPHPAVRQVEVTGATGPSARLRLPPTRVPRSVLRPRLHRVAQTAAPVVRTSGAVPHRDPRSPRSPFRSALPGPPVLWPLLTSRSASRRCPFRHKARSPQVRTSAFRARPPDLRRLPLVARASR